VWVLTKPLITEENWLGRGLNPVLANDTPALYPLLHELMLNISFLFKAALTFTYIYSLACVGKRVFSHSVVSIFVATLGTFQMFLSFSFC
jgi:hypothetical protein